MLEIILVIYLCRRIKGIVAPKGYAPGKWQLLAVLAWFGPEIAGVFFSFVSGSVSVIAILSGLLCAIGCSIALQRYAASLPDLRNGDEWLQNMGKHDAQDSY